METVCNLVNRINFSILVTILAEREVQRAELRKFRFDKRTLKKNKHSARFAETKHRGIARFSKGDKGIYC